MIQVAMRVAGETSTEYSARKAAELGTGWLNKLAREQHDPHAVKPWVVLAYSRNARNVRDVAIVAGYNRYTGQEISWIVPSFDDDERYDLTEAVEVEAR